jgi:hypothetical protein
MRKHVPLLLGVALAMLAPQSAGAGVRPWLRATAGWSQYTMDAVNTNEIANYNASGVDMDDLTGGISYAGDLGLDFGSGISIGVGYQKLAAVAEGSDGFATLELDYSAFSLRGFLERTFVQNEKSEATFGVAVGQIQLVGSDIIEAPGSVPSTIEYEGTGLLVEPYLAANIWIAPQLGLFGMGGYRMAKVEEVTSTETGDPVFFGNGVDVEADYTGFFARFGLTVALSR